ncbi:hypothetical protein [Dongia deserti]|uniref:hypothetical protein n=1 Tax=Dongia deserti TaxID=2268030 RepID=UPI0013C472FD|nr:hypothetical protein [Dongia deserti]
MQDISRLIRNLFLVGVVAFAPVAGCTMVEDDEEPDFQLDSDVDDDDDDVDVEVDD